MDAKLLTFEEVKRYLRVSSSTLYRMVQRGKIPASKVGRAWRFRKEKIYTWLTKQEKSKS